MSTANSSHRHDRLFSEDLPQGLYNRPSSEDKRTRPRPDARQFLWLRSSLNWDGYCNPEVDKLIDQQSIEGNRDRRRQLVWAIEHKLAEDAARPIIFYNRAATCWRPYVKGLTIMVNSIYNAN